MAFPGTYNISYYKGDTLEFKIYPKDASGAAFDLTGYFPLFVISIASGTNEAPKYFDLTGFSTAKFTIATARGSGATQILATAEVATDLTHVACVITPAQSEDLDPAIQYVYDVEISKTVPGGYPYVYTLLTGTLSITDQVSA